MLLSELKFGSYLTYTPRGETEVARKSINIRANIKSEKIINSTPPKTMSLYVVERMNKIMNSLPFKDFFDTNTSLVPIPKSALMKADSLWVPLKISKALEQMNMGTCYPCLERAQAVPKAAYCKPDERPDAEKHFETIKVKSILPRPQKIVLIDDVITRGATMIGCAEKLRTVFKDIPITGFAIMKTISNPNDFQKIECPCTGTIKHYSHGTFREP